MYFGDKMVYITSHMVKIIFLRSVCGAFMLVQPGEWNLETVGGKQSYEHLASLKSL